MKTQKYILARKYKARNAKRHIVTRSDDLEYLLWHYEHNTNDRYDYAIYTGGWKLLTGKEL